MAAWHDVDVARRWGCVSVLGYYVAVSVPAVRARTAAEKWYPSNFAGWDDLADAVRALRKSMPAGTRIVADNFKLGAELGFALDDADIAVLDHPLNHKHGRAPQLRLWGLQTQARRGARQRPVLLVVGATDVAYKHLLRRYHDLCAMDRAVAASARAQRRPRSPAFPAVRPAWRRATAHAPRQRWHGSTRR